MQFTKEHPSKFAQFQNWDDLHFRLMKGFPIDERDKKSITDNSKYGVIHCDINSSNYFYLPEENRIDVFDWDQIR
jgi:Ser/Thr protein kinase RdoA (MazF antagonist)